MKPLTSHRARKAALSFPALVPLSVALISHFATPSASAADRFWAGGNGAWTAGATGGWNATWTATSADTGNFTGAGGVVNLTTDVLVRDGLAATNFVSLGFNGSGDYTLSATAAQTITINSNLTTNPTGRVINVGTGRTATVGNNVTINTTTVNRSHVIGGADLTSKLLIDNGGTIRGNGTANSNVLSFNDITVEVKSGGALTTLEIGTQSGQPSGTALFVNGNLDVLGGTVTSHGTFGLGQGTGTAAGNLTLTTGSTGSISALSANGIRFGGNSGTTAGGTMNLDGGILSAFRIQKGTGTVTTSVLNLNGGLLKATATADGSNGTTAPFFIAGLGRANVRTGGAKIDSNGFNIAVSQDLLTSNFNGESVTDGGLTKSGLGTLTLSGNNTYNGATSVSGGALEISGTVGALTSTSGISITGGTLLLSGSAPNRINDSAGFITSSGAKIQLSVSNFNETVGSLSLGAGNTVIDFGGATGTNVLTFAASIFSGTGTLQVWNWSGNIGSGGGTDQLFFGTTAAGLTGGTSGSVEFFTGPGTGSLGSGTQLGTGELVPVPEPGALVSAAALGVAAFFRRRRTNVEG